MTGIIDLHMHTTASDGTDTPEGLAKKAMEAGIRIFAVTDHDTTQGADALKDRVPDGMVFIPGIEFSCRAQAGKCHILGYHCDTQNAVFRAAVDEGKALRKAKLDRRLAYLRDEKGIVFPPEALDGLARLSSVGRPHLASLLISCGYASDRQQAMEMADCPSGNSRIPARTAVLAILASGGVPVWAHPMGGEGERPVSREQFGQMLKELTGYGLKGLECYYSRYPMEVCRQLAEIAEERGLLVSGGSDYHGGNKTVRMGSLNADGEPVGAELLTVLTYCM